MSNAQPQLMRDLRLVALSGTAFLLLVAALLYAAAGGSFALRWSLAGAACWCVVLWQCYSRLDRNYSTADQTPYTRLGAGTRVTLVRGLLIAATAGFLPTAGMPVGPALAYAPAVFYTLAALGDALDGYIARRQRHTTQLGRELDTALDALGLLVAPLLAVLTGKLHASYLLASAAYYLFQWGVHRRRQRGLPVYPLPPSRWRRHIAGWQMGLVATVLWPPLPLVTVRKPPSRSTSSQRSHSASEYARRPASASTTT